MAVALEFNLICKRIIDLNQILQNPEIEKLEISVEKISGIDNWLWENQQEFEDMFLAKRALKEGKIIVINLKSRILKDLGIYVEKTNSEYVYSLWINTAGYPNLDVDKINPDNEYFYQRFYQVFGEVVKIQNIDFRILGIGPETNFQYEENDSDVIRKSENIIAWIGNKRLKDNMDLNDYKEKKVVGMDFLVFERR